MPATLEAQARLFASAGLVLAPNGGWAPNVIFMPPETQIFHQNKLYKKGDLDIDIKDMIVAAYTPVSESKVLLILMNYPLFDNEFLELAIGFLNCVISFFEYLSSSHQFFEFIN